MVVCIQILANDEAAGEAKAKQLAEEAWAGTVAAHEGEQEPPTNCWSDGNGLTY